MLVWNAGYRGATAFADWLDNDIKDVNGAIAKLEAAARTKGDWDENYYGGHDWWGLHGTFDGAVFTVYTHKSGLLKIGSGFDKTLDLAGLKTALMAVVNG